MNLFRGTRLSFERGPSMHKYVTSRSRPPRGLGVWFRHALWISEGCLDYDCSDYLRRLDWQLVWRIGVCWVRTIGQNPWTIREWDRANVSAERGFGRARLERHLPTRREEIRLCFYFHITWPSLGPRRNYVKLKCHPKLRLANFVTSTADRKTAFSHKTPKRTIRN